MTDRGLHLGLSRGERLRKRSAFLAAQQHGLRRSGRTLVVYALARTDASGHKGCRLGITVSKRIGTAVVRNRVKRWVRESYRRLRDDSATDVVVIAKPAAAGSNYHAIAGELRRHLLSIGES